MRKSTSVSKSKARFSYWLILVPLLLLIIIFVFWDKEENIQDKDLGTISDKEVALKETKKALKMVSEYLNEGNKNLLYLKEFNKTKDKIIKID
ncbi:hypothetical protein [Christiangramia salexigens]|uniref:Uncharacterized protein n=1 Tax=Christiangramia salexigens TaxID=1913577 RepID=A0A1L3J3K6_9FLAO|nr:hypothetical protein [Christiangramia salexigens]APG59709.1 hypothetical protein LPB144_04455 [Christiangramia salexigens]